MISIIVCSVREKLFREFEIDTEQGIGVPFEMIRIDNSKNKYSLCEAYNEGASRARYDILCFAHEDITIQTKNWGRIVDEIFRKNQKLGLLGVAGANYKSYVPSGWSFPSASFSTLRMNYLQCMKGMEREIHGYSNPDEELLSKVVCVDGMWFCTRREIALQMKFDDETFRGFHCYDVDYSLQVFQKHEVAVTYEILIRHFSEGSFNADWIKETLKLHTKWKSRLPANLANLDKGTQMQEENKALQYLLKKMLEFKYPLKLTLPVFWSRKALMLLGLKNFLKFNINIVQSWRKA